MVKLCPSCDGVELKKVGGERSFLYDLNRIVYTEDYHCPQYFGKCYGSYLYCKICMEMISVNAEGNRRKWASHLRKQHQKIFITPSTADQSLNITIFLDSHIQVKDYSAFLVLFAKLPQLLALTTADKHVYYREDQSDGELVNVIRDDIMNSNYSCRLCSMDYDSFPTLKLVHRHLRRCIIASQLAAPRGSKIRR